MFESFYLYYTFIASDTWPVTEDERLLLEARRRFTRDAQVAIHWHAHNLIEQEFGSDSEEGEDLASASSSSNAEDND